MSEAQTETTSAEETPSMPKWPSLFRNYISFCGFAIAAASLTSIALLILLEFYSTIDNPYTDLVTFIFVPSILGFGLFVAFAGALWERHQRRHIAPKDLKPFPILDLNDPRRRRSFFLFIVVAFGFLFISAFGSYRAYEYTESVTFCGQACHVPMKPEFTAYQASPHAKIRCVECHVGGGAEAYVKAKFNGMHQLWGVVSGHYNRPIESPVKNMREATETCQKCHWSEKYYGDQIRVFDHYGYDQQNSLNRTRLLVKVGGGSPDAGPVGGIHWHMSVANKIDFIATDEKRQAIPWVRMTDANGNVTEFTARDSGVTSQQINDLPKRRMDCIDCHNRPAHIYLSPNEAVDRSLDAQRLDIMLPFIKARAVETLSKPYDSEDEALATIASDIDGYYRITYGDTYNSRRDSITSAIKELQSIYATYFFPEMKTDWKAHPNNIGHFYGQGCFRCHDGQHFSPDGRVIRNDCNICHTTLDQTFRGQTISNPAGEFQHPVNLGDRGNWLCANCHKGDRTFVHPLNLGDISRFQCADCHSGNYKKVAF
ncbi:MAG TPA: NapC/NirT family cytochrome c [Pyrinomonadaceae bacterium]|jgi:nitrate/TMAO reductase-like tetraheme cytochrome c subunit|nr:NapC/NirT family cytochrome c [Pyrinomonadaceae bacterium]